MAGWSIVGIAILSLALTLASSEVQELRLDNDCPPGNPLCNIWVPCDYNGTVQTACRDCTTRVICTELGGWVRPCWLPGWHNCVEGLCGPEPSEECVN